MNTILLSHRLQWMNGPKAQNFDGYNSNRNIYLFFRSTHGQATLHHIRKLSDPLQYTDVEVL